MNMSSIMRFEDLLGLWQDQHTERPILEFLGIRSQGDVRGADASDPSFLRILRERLDGTWWEVTWSGPPLRPVPSRTVRCRYLADSLNDAIRRCPDAQISPGTPIDEVDDSTADDELNFPERTRGRRRSMATWADE